jgi:soluble lytic murein transglycosylase
MGGFITNKQKVMDYWSHLRLIPVRLYRIGISLLFAAVFIFVLKISGSCDIYRYVDKNGVMHFTNVPTSNAAPYRVYIREPSNSRSTSSSSVKSRGGKRAPFHGLIAQVAEEEGIAESLLKAIIKAESNFDPYAISKKGAMGLMQIMPINFKDLDIRDPFDPEQNIKGGARYFSQLLKRFGGNLQLALAAYNAGPEAVEQYKRIPPYKETMKYVKRVMRYYKTYRKS